MRSSCISGAACNKGRCRGNDRRMCEIGTIPVWDHPPMIDRRMQAGRPPPLREGVYSLRYAPASNRLPQIATLNLPLRWPRAIHRVAEPRQARKGPYRPGTSCGLLGRWLAGPQLFSMPERRYLVPFDRLNHQGPNLVSVATFRRKNHAHNRRRYGSSVPPYRAYAPSHRSPAWMAI